MPGFFEGTEMPAAGWWEALWPDPAGVLTAIGIAVGMTVVDLCSGDGWFTLPIAKRTRHVIAIDIDPQQLELARHRLAENGVTNCDLVKGDAYDLARLVAGPVDFVFLANAFHGVPDRPRLARAVRTVLAPAGRFAVVNWHRRPREETKVLGEPRGPRTDLRMTPQQTVEATEPAGLRLSALVEVAPYHYAAIFECFPSGTRVSLRELTGEQASHPRS
ncbi:MAG TPA: class I SAM-dependent methyltransferase [Xanthobacteraceae bacterium]